MDTLDKGELTVSSGPELQGYSKILYLYQLVLQTLREFLIRSVLVENGTPK